MTIEHNALAALRDMIQLAHDATQYDEPDEIATQDKERIQTAIAAANAFETYLNRQTQEASDAFFSALKEFKGVPI